MSRIGRACDVPVEAERAYREIRTADVGTVDERLLGIRLARLVLDQHTPWILRGDHETYVLCNFDGEPYPCEIAAAVLDVWAPGGDE